MGKRGHAIYVRPICQYQISNGQLILSSVSAANQASRFEIFTLIRIFLKFSDMKLPPEHQTHSRQTERGEIINRCDIFAQGVATFSQPLQVRITMKKIYFY